MELLQVSSQEFMHSQKLEFHYLRSRVSEGSITFVTKKKSACAIGWKHFQTSSLLSVFRLVGIKYRYADARCSAAAWIHFSNSIFADLSKVFSLAKEDALIL